MYYIPSIEECVDFAKSMGCSNILEIPIKPREWDQPFRCHANCLFNPILGYYIVKDSHNILHAFKHSVLNLGDKLVDVTPTIDDRNYNIFCYGTPHTEEHLTYLENSVFINRIKGETELTYYVYGLIDPRDNSIFYIGKGKDDRALSHFYDHVLKKEGNTRKTAKIKKLQSLGYKPMIEFFAQNIEDEQLAYKIEESLILKYGRIGYEENGTLTNVCIGNNPPNHRGKTYEEIYGDKAEAQRASRHESQLKRGGYFRGHSHTEETKLNHSKIFSGRGNPRYGIRIKDTPIAKKIGEAHKGKKHYNRKGVKLLFIEGLDKFIYSNDLAEFCKTNNYSVATFRSQLVHNWPTSSRGKNKGLKIRLATETELTSYTTGDTKMDVNENSFKGFSI